MGKQEGVGVWANPEFLDAFAGLPVVQAGRVITSNIIDHELRKGQKTVFSIGIGTGVMYKPFLDTIQNRKLNLIGIDILPEMIETSNKLLGRNKNCILSVKDAREEFPIPQRSVDIVEASLVLHHILKTDELTDIFKRINTILKPGGKFILYDIDVDIGSYIESKLQKLEKEYDQVDIDFKTAEFTFRDGQTAKKQKILDPAQKNDQEIIENMDMQTCNPLIMEMELYKPDLRRVIMDNISNARQGLEWHRSIKDWRELISMSFDKTSSVEIFDSTIIKKEFQQVLDSPFLMVTTKE